MAPLGRPPVMLDIVEEHVEELDFLWELREAVIFAPDWTLDDLADLEERAEAHLDGLRLAELHAVDIARPHLVGKHKFAATAATFVMMESGEAEFVDEVGKAFVETKPEPRDGIRIGLRHSKIDAIEKRLFELSREGDPGVRAAAADVLAFHRCPIPEIRDLLSDEDDAVRILAFGALGRGSVPLDELLITAGLQSKPPAVRRAVLEGAARSRTPGLDALCRAAAGRALDPDAEALAFLGVLGSPQDLRILLDSLDVPELHLGALRGLAALGDVAAVPKLLDWIESEEDSAGEAASAFARITGAGNLEAESPAAEDPRSRSVAEEFETEAPTPDPAKARGFWSARQRALAPGRRWQAGIDVTASAQDVAPRRDLQLALRRDLYLSLRARRGGSVRDVELEGRARAQT